MSVVHLSTNTKPTWTSTNIQCNNSVLCRYNTRVRFLGKACEKVSYICKFHGRWAQCLSASGEQIRHRVWLSETMNSWPSKQTTHNTPVQNQTDSSVMYRRHSRSCLDKVCLHQYPRSQKRLHDGLKHLFIAAIIFTNLILATYT